MKATNSLENRKERSLEALACPVDHPGVIKIQYLHMKTYESYSLWWNGGSLKHMRVYDYQVPDVHESRILEAPGPDFDSRKRLVVYRKHRAYLAWALMCIVDVVHKHDVLHNDLNPNNVMLHFPQDRENTVFIGVCDWGMASWGDEDAPSNYGKDSVDEMNKHKAQYNCAGPELFHVRGQRGTSTSPMRMARKHRHTFLSESFSVGALAKKIYHKDSTSPLFQHNRDPNGLKMRFEVALDALTKTNPADRSTITHEVNILKSPPYNMVNPTMCFRDTAK
jgi:serine/threonine protein kinase